MVIEIEKAKGVEDGCLVEIQKDTYEELADNIAIATYSADELEVVK